MSAFFAHQRSFVRKNSILAEVCFDVNAFSNEWQQTEYL